MGDLLKKPDTVPETTVQASVPANSKGGFASHYNECFRVQKAFADSELVPDTFRKPVNAMIALDIADRLGANPLMVMQSLHIVHGKPAWSSQFLISCINSCRRFTPLHYKTVGETGKDSHGVIAWAKSVEDGEIVESPAVTIDMQKKEGWYGKSGSKWQNMPNLMLRYRQATLFSRLYCPEILMGLRPVDEVEDIQPEQQQEVVIPDDSKPSDLLKGM